VALPIEEDLHLLEKLYPILLQHNEMRSLTDLDKPLVRTTRGCDSTTVGLFGVIRATTGSSVAFG